MVKKNGKNKTFLETFDFSPNFHMRINVPTGKAFFNAQETLSLAHWHEEIEIVYCISGRDTFVINGISVQGKRGQLIVINPGDIHYVSVIDPRTQSDYNLEENAYVTFFISKSYYEQFFQGGVCPRFENIITESYKQCT